MALRCIKELYNDTQCYKQERNSRERERELIKFCVSRDLVFLKNSLNALHQRWQATLSPWLLLFLLLQHHSRRGGLPESFVIHSPTLSPRMNTGNDDHPSAIPEGSSKVKSCISSCFITRSLFSKVSCTVVVVRSGKDKAWGRGERKAGWVVEPCLFIIYTLLFILGIP